MTQVGQNNILTMGATDSEYNTKDMPTVSNFGMSGQLPPSYIKQDSQNDLDTIQANQARIDDGKKRADRVANLSPLKFYHRAPIPRFTFGLDNDEREMVQKGKKVTKHDIWELLERKRFQELNKAAV